MLLAPASCRLIVKVGSALLVAADGPVRRAWLEVLATDLAERTRAEQQVVASSGLIVLRAWRPWLTKRGRASLEDA